MIFEGGWLDPYMATTYPDTTYAWAPMPQGAEQATLGLHGQLLDRRRFGQQGRRLGPAPVPHRP